MPASTHIARTVQCRFQRGARRMSRRTLLFTAALAFTITGVLLASETALASISLTEGQAFHGNLGTLTLNCSWGGDPNVTTYPQCPGQELERVVINWGDGTGTDTSGTATLASCGSETCDYTIAASHTYRAGQFQISYSITYQWFDAGFIPTEDTVNGSNAASVTDPPLKLQQTGGLSQTVGSSPAVTLATLNDEDPTASSGYYMISIDWGDRSAPQTGSTAATGSPGGFVIRGSHAYAKIGNYTAAVTVTDFGGAAAATSTSIAVTPASLSLAGTSGLTATADASTGLLQLATVTDTNTLASASDFHATIAWGDATTSEAILTPLSPGRFSLTGTHTYASPGSFTASVAVDDGNSAHATTTTTIGVAAAHGVICATPGTGLRTSEASPLNEAVLARFADANPNLASSDFTASIEWGDGSPLAIGTIENAAAPSPPCIGPSFEVDSTHTYAEAGTYTVTVAIADHSGATSVVTTTTSVADQPLTDRGAPVLLLKRGEFSGTVLVARFTDANPLARISDYRATIDWGDGTPRAAGTIDARAGQPLAVSAGHTYNTNGSHRITVTISDRGGASTSAQTTAVVKSVPIAGGVRERFQSTAYRPYYTTVASLLIHDAARGSHVLVRCHGHGCPYRQETINVKHGSLNLAREFRNRHLTPGTYFAIALTNPGWCGKYWTYRVRAAALPAASGPIYLAPGATRPGKGC